MNDRHIPTVLSTTTLEIEEPPLSAKRLIRRGA